MDEKEKKSLLRKLLEAGVDIGAGTVETALSLPHLLGTGILAGGEALASGVDLSDREGIPF